MVARRFEEFSVHPTGCQAVTDVSNVDALRVYVRLSHLQEICRSISEKLLNSFPIKFNTNATDTNSDVTRQNQDTYGDGSITRTYEWECLLRDAAARGSGLPGAVCTAYKECICA